MYPRQKFDRSLLVPLQHCHLVRISFHLQTGISFPAIRVNRTARLDRLRDEGLQAGSRGIPDPTQSDASDTLPLFLASHSNQNLCFRPATASPLLQSAQVCLVHFHPTAEAVTARSHHSSPQFVQPSPGGDIAAQAQNPLQPQGTGSVLLGGHPPHGPEPHGQRFPCILEDRTSRQRRLVLTASADEQIALGRPSRRPAAAWTNETFWPTKLEQVVPTRLLRPKSGLQFGQRGWVVLHRPLPQHIGLLESTKYPDDVIRERLAHNAGGDCGAARQGICLTRCDVA